jgi:hypothetical protein
MSQSDGEPAWQSKTYNASKNKKHLTGINKEGGYRRWKHGEPKERSIFAPKRDSFILVL